MSAVAVLLVAIALPNGLSEATGAGKSLPERWRLTLIPKDIPKLPDSVFRSMWSYGGGDRGDPSAGVHRVTFDTAAGKSTTVVTISREKGRETKVAPFAVYGSLMEYDGQLSTYYLTERHLLKRVAVRVSPRTWYRAQSDSYSDGTMTVEEFLFAFVDDPAKVKEGTVKVTRAVRTVKKGKEGRPKREELTATYKPRGSEQGDRFWLVLRPTFKPGEPQFGLPSLQFREEGKYAWFDGPGSSGDSWRKGRLAK
jgi:hypothetical protein